MPLARLRSSFFLAFVFSMLALGGAFYLESAFGLQPCPLCYSQRFVLGAFAIVCLVALVRSPGRLATRVYTSVLLVFAAFGAALATRQVWLQSRSTAPQVECAHPLGYLFEHARLSELIDALLIGTRECAVLTWSFLDLSVAEWSLLAFLLLGLFPLSRLLAGCFASRV